jgi:hypothetical protein
MGKCKSIPESINDVVVLTVKLSDKTILNSPEIIRRTLRNSKLQHEIQKNLLEEVNRLSARRRKEAGVTVEDSEQLMKKASKPFVGIAAGDVKKQILYSPEYKKLKTSTRKLQCSFNDTPVGVFVDRNKGWLIFVAAGLAVGSLTAMYITQKGDTVGNISTRLIGNKVKFKMLGKMTVGAKDLKFEPSKRLIGTTIFANANWERIKLKYDMKIVAEGSKLSKTSASSEVLVKLSQPFSLKAKGMVGYLRPKEKFQNFLIYNFQFGLKYKLKDTGLEVSTMAFVSQKQEVRSRGGRINFNYLLYGDSVFSSNTGTLKIFGKGGQKELFTPTGSTTKNEYSFGLELFGRY